MERELRLAVAEVSGAEWRLLATDHEPLPAGAGIVGAEGVADASALGRAMRSLLQRQSLRGARLRVMVPGAGEVLRRFLLPVATEAAAVRTIRLQPDQFLPVHSGRLCADYFMLPAAAGAPERDLVIEAMPEQVLTNLRRAFRLGGADAPEVLPLWAPLCRLACRGDIAVRHGVGAAIHVGAGGSLRVYVFKDGMAVAGRTLLSAIDDPESFFEVRQSIQPEGQLPTRIRVVAEADVADWCAGLEAALNRLRPSPEPGAPAGAGRIEVQQVSGLPVPTSGWLLAAALTLPPGPGEPAVNLFHPRLIGFPVNGWRQVAVAALFTAAAAAVYGHWWWGQWTKMRTEVAQLSATPPPVPAAPAGLRLVPAYREALAELDRSVPWSTILGSLHTLAQPDVAITTLSVSNTADTNTGGNLGTAAPEPASVASPPPTGAASPVATDTTSPAATSTVSPPATGADRTPRALSFTATAPTPERMATFIEGLRTSRFYRYVRVYAVRRQEGTHPAGSTAPPAERPGIAFEVRLEVLPTGEMSP